VTQQLKSRNMEVLEKHSLAARCCILTAPVLIYSHGEDDLDNFMFLLRPFVGLRVLLRHGLTYLKGPKKHDGSLVRRDFDWAVACTELEAVNFGITFTDRQDNIILGGGAHLDRFISARNIPKERYIVYMPTHRESAKTEKLLNECLSIIVNSKTLRDWLLRNDFKLVLARHINRPTHEQNVDSPFNDLIVYAEPDEMINYVLRCQLLISDYSAILSSYLILDMPAVFFPFDIVDYLKYRTLYMDYEKYRYGPSVDAADKLVNFITTKDWFSSEFMHDSRRKALKDKFFPHNAPVYSQKTYEAIEGILSEH